MVRLLLDLRFGLRLRFDLFQSHNGAIAAQRSFVKPLKLLRFNPTMVRLLPVRKMQQLFAALLQFQSHNGAIAAYCSDHQPN